MLSIDFYRPNYDMDVKELVDRLIDLSFAEDIGDGDHTTLCCIPEDAMGKSHLLIKEDGILAGVEVAKEVFHRFDPTMQVEVLMQDGARVKKGDIAMIVTGKTRSLLQTERLMLNIMQRMSGIATMTDKYVQHLKGTKTRVLDTRKTTPGMRMLEKQAVKIGGGCNHRIGLFDMILLQRACRMICDIFRNSQVYRTGGDEFVVILTGEDYAIREELLENLRRESAANSRSRSGPVIASGMAVYDKKSDAKLADVVKRADEEMYENKSILKSDGPAPTFNNADRKSVV